MLKRLFMLSAVAASIGAAIGYAKARTAFRTWGVDPTEATRPLPGDSLVPEADGIDTRAIDIDAPPAEVWPWLVQMGYGRAGWYSYDELDTNQPSADRIIPELQQLAVGDVLPTHPGGGFEVRILDPEHALVLYADRALVQAQDEEARAAEQPAGLDQASANVRATGAYLNATMRGDFQASWAFVLEPRGEHGTRLIERFRGRLELPSEGPGAQVGPAIAGKAMLFGLFVMTRRQLLGIRARAEGRPLPEAPWRAFMRTPMAMPAPAPLTA